jgi:superfamily II DNA/RNA helicase
MSHHREKTTRNHHSKPAPGRSFSSRPGKPTFGSFRRPAPAKRAVKSFDPSLFIRKVEEQAIAMPAEYTPKHRFTDFQIDQRLKENILAKGYVAPTPIQDQAIPVLLEGKDIIATANTGTGKTAAFLIPLIHNVLNGKTDRVLVIAPTRELATQINQELRSFTKNTDIRSALCIGGLSAYSQAKELKRLPAFVIGTPGRLIDLEENGALHFGNYNAIVLDEVDTMLDMGFINDVRHIIGALPAQRHALFFSATIPVQLKQIMDSFLRNPISVSVKTRQSAENVNQDVLKIGDSSKVELLHDLLITPACKKSILFVRTKRAADKLAKELAVRGFKVAAIHGDKTQGQRNKALQLFKDDKVNVLLATDVVSRGIDIEDVSHVINYDLPQTHEDYIHRIGRTGRAGKIGQAITFIE